MITQDEIYREITEERQAQDEQWGHGGHSYAAWIKIIGKHYGRLCAADLDMDAAVEPWGDDMTDRFTDAKARYRRRLIVIAALAVAALEDLA